jgi:pimeloyl-ACP methyl ester carboxylesterase
MAMTALARAALTALLILLGFAPSAGAQEAVGEWHGVIQAGGVELRVGVTITKKPDGSLAGLMASVDQGGSKIPLADVQSAQDRFSFAAPAVGGRYEGTWDEKRSAWDGRWTQGQSFSLVLARGPVPMGARPQVPARPYPYREEEVTFDSAPGVTLAGTLTVPPGEGPFPAAVLLTGSGPQDRDESLLGHKPFLVLADHLTRHGVAVLRYDDRGFGKSTGKFPAATSADFTADAAAALAFLRGRKEIATGRVGLIGHSEGGMIAPMVAAKDQGVAFVVLLAGPGAPSRDLMAAQRAAVGRAIGAPPEAIARREAVMGRIETLLAETADWEAAKVEVVRILGEAAAEGGVPADQMVGAAQFMLTPWYRDFIAHDPRPNLRALKMPVLALNGANDLQVVASQNLPLIREALKDNPDATVVELPGLNHLFQTSETGSPQAYGRIEETFAPAALETISAWIVARMGR